MRDRRLHPQTDSVDSSCAQLVQTFRRDIVGVAFDRDLRAFMSLN